jgi:hypothetical protein
MGDWVGSDTSFHSTRPRGVQRVAALPARATTLPSPDCDHRFKDHLEMQRELQQTRI